MREVFADTGYWIAMIDKGDARRSAAVDAAIKIGGTRIVTTSAVLTEVLNHFSGLTGIYRDNVAFFIQRTMNSDDVRVVRVADPLFNDGLTMYAAYRDKKWSHVDCMSFAVMRRRGITDALAHDEHFRQAGFTTLMG